MTRPPPAQALAYTSDSALCMCTQYGGYIAALRVRGVAHAAAGDGASATQCLESAASSAAEQGLFMLRVLALQAMVVCGVGGAEAPQRLGSMLRRMEGSPEQIARLLRGRDDAPTVDVAALLR